jgi:hypothetical protein
MLTVVGGLRKGVSMTLLAGGIPMPTDASPPFGPSMWFTAASGTVVIALLVWWWVSGEHARGPVMPLLFVGIAISGIAVEPIFDNTLLYWYPPNNPLGVYSAFDRTVPWFVPLGYAWFFGGSSYILWRLFVRGISRAQIGAYFAVLVLIDAVATSTVGWIRISGFYGDQPFMVGGINIWFSFADATAGVVGAVILYLVVPRLKGWNWLWLVVIPTISYGAVLGGVTSPVVLGLHSDWTTFGRWLGGAGTIALCCIVAHGCAAIGERDSAFRVLVDRGVGAPNHPQKMSRGFPRTT